MSEPRKHAHYFRSIKGLDQIDLYRFFELFGVTDQALGHAIKKLVVPGMRGGGKATRQDIQEAIDTLQRKLEMMDEDQARVAQANGPAALNLSGPVLAGVLVKPTYRAHPAADS